jgi:hypothetical protein
VLELSASLDIRNKVYFSLLDLSWPITPEFPVCVPPVCITFVGVFEFNIDIVAQVWTQIHDIGFRRTTTEVKSIEWSSGWDTLLPRIRYNRPTDIEILSPSLSLRQRSPPNIRLRFGIGPGITVKMFGALFPLTLYFWGEIGLMSDVEAPGPCVDGVTMYPYWSLGLGFVWEVIRIDLGWGMSLRWKLTGAMPFHWNATLVPPQPIWQDKVACLEWPDLITSSSSHSSGGGHALSVLPPLVLGAGEDGGGAAVRGITTAQCQEGLDVLDGDDANPSDVKDVCVACVLRGCAYCPTTGTCASRHESDCPVVGSCESAELPAELIFTSDVPTEWMPGTTVEVDWVFLGHRYALIVDGVIRFALVSVETGTVYCGAGLPCYGTPFSPTGETLVSFTVASEKALPAGDYRLVAYADNNPAFRALSNVFSYSAGTVGFPLPDHPLLTASSECTEECGLVGHLPWSPEPEDAFAGSIPCNRRPCPEAPLRFTAPTRATAAVDGPITFAWSGGRADSYVVVEYLDETCGEFRFLGYTKNSEFRWNPPFHDYYRPGLYGGPARTRIRITLEQDPSNFAVAPVPTLIPGVRLPSQWEIFPDGPFDGLALSGKPTFNLLLASGEQVDAPYAYYSSDGRLVVDWPTEKLVLGFPSAISFTYQGLTERDWSHLLLRANVHTYVEVTPPSVLVFPGECGEHHVLSHCSCANTLYCPFQDALLPCSPVETDALLAWPTLAVDFPGLVTDLLAWQNAGRLTDSLWVCSGDTRMSDLLVRIGTEGTSVHHDNEQCVLDIDAISALPFDATRSFEEKNQAYREVSNDEEDGGLSTVAIALIASASICTLLLCCGLIVVVVTLARRGRIRTPSAAMLQRRTGNKSAASGENRRSRAASTSARVRRTTSAARVMSGDGGHHHHVRHSRAL